MHGQYIRNVDGQLISEEDTFLWLSKVDLKAETDSSCRLCQKFDETVDHTISACPILTKERCIKKHDRVSAQLHCNICKEMGAQLDTKHRYEHVPKSVETTQG